MGCLDDSTIFDFASGSLPPDAVRDVDAHIDQCADCRMIVAGLVRTTDSTAPSGYDATIAGPGALGSSSPGRKTPLARGQALGDKYLVLETLGAGAMGVVYAAWDSALERHVAIKTLQTSSQWNSQKERFAREAKAMAKLAHPNVAAAYDVGEVEGTAFIAMEYVDGGTLREWAEKTSPDWRESRGMCLQVAAGLAAAHDKGLIHRDVKPENVLVGRDGRPRVTDFGLASLAGRTSIEQSKNQPLTLTMTGAVMGTPAYMAPEQFRSQEVSAKTDQYSFCVMMWELVYGRRPIAEASFDAQLAKVLAGELPKPPPGPPSWLGDALRKGLSVDPAERHASMDELVEALSLDLRGTPGRRIAVGAFVAGLGIAAALFAGRGHGEKAEKCTGGEKAASAVWPGARGDALRERGPVGRAFAAELDAWSDRFATLHTSTCRATHVLGEQSSELLDARMSCLRKRATEVDALLGAIETDASALAKASLALSEMPELASCTRLDDAGPTPPAEAEALAQPLADARATLALGRAGQAAKVLEELAESAKRVGFAPLVAEVSLLWARALWEAGELEDAEGRALEAQTVAMASGADETMADAWIARMGVAGSRGDLARARGFGQQARAAIERIGGSELLSDRLEHGMGVLLYNHGDLAAARPLLEASHARRLARYGPLHTALAASHTSLGNLERAASDLPAALRHHREALRIDGQVLGESHPNIGQHEHNIAGIYRRMERADLAETHYRRALANSVAAHGSEHPSVALTRNSLGLLALAAGRFGEAEDFFSAAEDVLARTGHSEAGAVAYNRGLVAEATEKFALAREHYRRAQTRTSPDAPLADAIAERLAPPAPSRPRVGPKREKSEAAASAARLKDVAESATYAPSQRWE